MREWEVKSKKEERESESQCGEGKKWVKGQKEKMQQRWVREITVKLMREKGKCKKEIK